MPPAFIFKLTSWTRRLFDNRNFTDINRSVIRLINSSGIYLIRHLGDPVLTRSPEFNRVKTVTTANWRPIFFSLILFARVRVRVFMLKLLTGYLYIIWEYACPVEPHITLGVNLMPVSCKLMLKRPWKRRGNLELFPRRNTTRYNTYQEWISNGLVSVYFTCGHFPWAL